MKVNIGVNEWTVEFDNFAKVEAAWDAVVDAKVAKLADDGDALTGAILRVVAAGSTVAVTAEELAGVLTLHQVAPLLAFYERLEAKLAADGLKAA